MNITYQDVYEGDRFKNNKFLYVLLGARKPHQNISHVKMPTYDEHITFIHSRPYLTWELISVDDVYVGAWYMSKRMEIGIFILEEHQNQGIGKQVLEHIYYLYPRTTIYANVNDANRVSAEFFKRNDFQFKMGYYTGRVMQVTYWRTTPARTLTSDPSAHNQSATTIPEV